MVYFQGAKYFILLGNYLEKNYGNKLYGKAQNLVRVLRQAYDDALQKYDVLVMPTTQMKAPKIPLKTTPKEGNLLIRPPLFIHNQPMNDNVFEK